MVLTARDKGVGIVKSGLRRSWWAAPIVALLTIPAVSAPSVAGGDPNNPEVPADCTLSQPLYIAGDYDMDQFPIENTGVTASSDFGQWIEDWYENPSDPTHADATSIQSIKNITGNTTPVRTLYNIKQSYIFISSWRAQPPYPVYLSVWDDLIDGYADSLGGVIRAYNDPAHTDQLMPTTTVANLQPVPPATMTFGSPFTPTSRSVLPTDPATQKLIANKIDPGATSPGLPHHFYMELGTHNKDYFGIFTWSYITGQVCAPLPTIQGTTVVLPPNASPPVQTLTGTGTYPGDVIEVFDEHGTSIGTSVVSPEQTWSLPGVTVPLGTHPYSVKETDFFHLIGNNNDVFKVIPTPERPPTPPTADKPSGKTAGHKTPRSLPNTGS